MNFVVLVLLIFVVLVLLIAVILEVLGVIFRSEKLLTVAVALAFTCGAIAFTNVFLLLARACFANLGG